MFLLGICDACCQKKALSIGCFLELFSAVPFRNSAVITSALACDLSGYTGDVQGYGRFLVSFQLGDLDLMGIVQIRLLMMLNQEQGSVIITSVIESVSCFLPRF